MSTERPKTQGGRAQTKSERVNEEIKSTCTAERSFNYFFDMFSPDTPASIKLLIPDTILLENGCITYWFRTGSQGYLLKMCIDPKYSLYESSRRMTYKTLFDVILKLQLDEGHAENALISAEYVESYYYKSKTGQLGLDKFIEHCPPLVVVKFGNEKCSHFLRPLDLYKELTENMRAMRFIQLFVYSRGKQTEERLKRVDCHILCRLLFPFDNSPPICTVSKVLVCRAPDIDCMRRKSRTSPAATATTRSGPSTPVSMQKWKK